jgi:hypothetical protein
MRTTLIIALSLCCIAGTVFAQTAPSRSPPKATDAPGPAAHTKKAKRMKAAEAEEKAPALPDSKNLRDWYQDCLTMWDTATHMNKRDWDRACLRSAERLKEIENLKDMAVK